MTDREQAAKELRKLRADYRLLFDSPAGRRHVEWLVNAESGLLGEAMAIDDSTARLSKLDQARGIHIVRDYIEQLIADD